MACYPGQPRLDEHQGDPLSDSEDCSSSQHSLHSTHLIVKWLEHNYHYEQGMCLPRSTIYEHYVDFCERENVQPIINAASFGKLIRQQFSSLTTRRLGTRGKSKYHYYGLGIKPTSLYYNEEYCKKQKEGVARKEPESKKVHPIYPKENPSTILPPFPDVNQLKFLQDVSKGKLTTFMVMYQTHCQRILDSVTRANFSEVENFLLHFWQAMPPHLLPVLASSVVVDLVALCDTLLYSVVSSVLIISPIQSFPESLLQEVLKFCGQLGPWLDSATASLPESLRHIKQKTAKTFVKTLKRQIAIMELAKATRKALQREDQLTQLYRDWEGLDMHAVLAQVLYAVEPLNLPPSSLNTLPELLHQFVSLLADKTSVEDFVEWGQTILDTTLKQCNGGSEGLVQACRMFILTWKLFTSKISREITLQNAPSFGTFHLIHMLMDDYLLHLLETRLEKEQQREYRKKILLPTDDDKDLVLGDLLQQHRQHQRVDTRQHPQQSRPLFMVESAMEPRSSAGLFNTISLHGSAGIPEMAPMVQTVQLESPTSTTPSLSPTLQVMAVAAAPRDLSLGGSSGRGGGGGGGGRGSRSLPDSPLLEAGHHHTSSHTTHQVASTPPSASSTFSSSLPMPAPSHSPSVLTPSNLSLPSLGTAPPLPAFPVLSQSLPPPLPSISTASLPSHLAAHTAPPPPPMTQLMQGLHNALAPHQSSSIQFSNHLATATNPFAANTLTSMAGSFSNPSPSLPLLPAIYPYGPYGGMGGVPVVQSGPVNVGMVGGGPINGGGGGGGGGPGNIPAASFPSHSLMPAYSSYIPPAMYPGNQVNATPSST